MKSQANTLRSQDVYGGRAVRVLKDLHTVFGGATKLGLEGFKPVWRWASSDVTATSRLFGDGGLINVRVGGRAAAGVAIKAMADAYDSQAAGRPHSGLWLPGVARGELGSSFMESLTSGYGLEYIDSDVPDNRQAVVRGRNIGTVLKTLAERSLVGRHVVSELTGVAIAHVDTAVAAVSEVYRNADNVTPVAIGGAVLRALVDLPPRQPDVSPV